jgi:hypothetical protein
VISENTLDQVQGNPEAVGKIAYLAGLLDGEGCFQAYIAERGLTQYRIAEPRHLGLPYMRTAYQVCIEMAMCDEKVIRWVHQNFGGAIAFKDSRRRNKACRDQWHWRMWNDTALALLKQIYPYLIGKKRQAALIFKFMEVKKQKVKPGSHRWQLRDEVLRKIAAEVKSNHLYRLKPDAVETVHDEAATPMIQSDLHGDMQES